MGSSAAATCTSAWVSTPPVRARVSTMVNAIPFLWLKGWHAPAGRRTCEPRPLVQDGQIRPAPPVGARKPGARPTNRFAGQPERRQPTRRSGRDPGPPTLRPRQVTVGEAAPEARSTLSLPTRSGRQFDRLPSSLTTLLRRPLCVVDRSPPGKRHGVYGLAAHD